MTLAPSIPVPAAASAREIAVLRLIGRLGVVEAPWVGRLLFRDVSQRSMQETLTGLVDRHLLWRMEGRRQLRASAPGKRPTPRPAPFVYGLTADARSMLSDLGAEPRDGTLERLIARDRRAPLPTLSSLDDDLAASAWCASVLDHARRTPMLAGANLQAGYQIADGEGQLVQTIGAVLTLAFNPKGQQVARPAWELPWLSGEALDPFWKLVRLALEVDAGAANTLALMAQAQTYGQLTQAKVYDRVFGGAVKPVVLVLLSERAGKVATAWHDAWPGNPAVVTSAARAIHPDHGALWGTYFTLKDNPVQPATLLGGLVSSLENWAKLVANWSQQGSWAG